MHEKTVERSREGLEPHVVRAAKAAGREGAPMSLILLDIDDFRQVNETYGHDVGDQVLAELPEVVQQHVSAPHSFLRWGGEEYAILAPGVALEEAEVLAETTRAAVAGHAFSGAGRVTVSLGVATQRAGESTASLIERAVRAVYQAKTDGKNRVHTA